MQWKCNTPLENRLKSHKKNDIDMPFFATYLPSDALFIRYWYIFTYRVYFVVLGAISAISAIFNYCAEAHM